MDNNDKLDQSFLKLFKLLDMLRDCGAKHLGKKKLEFLVTLSYRQERSLFIVDNAAKEHPDGICQKDLARELKTTMPATSVLVESMIKKNLFVRTRSERDRRSYCLHLTPFGQQTLELIKTNIHNLTSCVTEGISHSDLECFCNSVDHISDRLEVFIRKRT
ncbi:MAG: hypothetical protein Q4G68_01215 [Planctomycetia bacterium]|nr:hypothetical protein [Planctomycetia bacterium]